MKKLWLMPIATLALLGASAFAADSVPDKTAPATEGADQSWTLEKARTYAHSYADKLDKMTPAEWAEHQKKRQEWRDKWHKMSQDEKDAWIKKQRDKHAAEKSDAKPAAKADSKPAN